MSCYLIPGATHFSLKVTSFVSYGRIQVNTQTRRRKTSEFAEALVLSSGKRRETNILSHSVCCIRSPRSLLPPLLHTPSSLRHFSLDSTGSGGAEKDRARAGRNANKAGRAVGKTQHGWRKYGIQTARQTERRLSSWYVMV